MATAIAPDAATSTPASPPRMRGRLFQQLGTPRRALCAAVAVAIAAVGLDALSDPDVFWHLRLGQWILDTHRVPATELFSYTAQGNPLVAHEWLSDTVFALLAGAGGLFLVSLLMGLVAWSGLIATALRGRARGAGPVAIAIGLALAARAAEPVLGTRPQVFTFALVCATLLIAESYLRHGGRRRWLLPPLMLVWANLHAGFLAGLALLALVVVVEAVKRLVRMGDLAPRDRIRGLAVVLAVAAVAACVNPAGPSLYHFALTLVATESQKGIIEWQSPNFHDPGMWGLLALLITFAAMPALGARLDPRDAVLAAAGTAVALLAVRNTALCVALIAPAWMSMAADVGNRLPARRTRPRPARAASSSSVIRGGVLVVIAAIGAGTVAARVHQDASPAGVAGAYPACAAAVLARSPVPQRLFTAYAAAGYLIDRAWPRVTVYEYGESESLGVAVFDDYVRIAGGAQSSPNALQLLQASDTTAVLYPSGDLTVELERSGTWTRVLDDHGMLLLIRGDPSWASGARC